MLCSVIDVLNQRSITEPLLRDAVNGQQLIVSHSLESGRIPMPKINDVVGLLSGGTVGTRTMPGLDGVARVGVEQSTDGSGAITVTAASTERAAQIRSFLTDDITLEGRNFALRVTQ